MLDFYVISLRDKRLFKITEVEIMRVDYMSRLQISFIKHFIFGVCIYYQNKVFIKEDCGIRKICSSLDIHIETGILISSGNFFVFIVSENGRRRNPLLSFTGGNSWKN